MITKEKKYAFIQISAEMHEELKNYCQHHGFKLGAFVNNLIRKELKGKKDGR